MTLEELTHRISTDEQLRNQFMNDPHALSELMRVNLEPGQLESLISALHAERDAPESVDPQIDWFALQLPEVDSGEIDWFANQLKPLRK